MYVCELRQAKPRALGHAHPAPADLSMQAHKLQPALDAAGSMMVAPDATQAANARLSWASASGGTAAGRVSGDAAPNAMQAKVQKATPVRSKRNLTVQVFLHCARIDVSSSRRLPYSACACIVRRACHCVQLNVDQLLASQSPSAECHVRGTVLPSIHELPHFVPLLQLKLNGWESTTM